ncbi:M43 family zinc metalloprotease [Flagellimonas sp. S174]|uniref:M43 family zinc metalloprotease n=1 Tax=Flagellimonas sp. S174 TaxID=3410790 RepID=UPI003BF49541
MKKINSRLIQIILVLVLSQSCSRDESVQVPEEENPVNEEIMRIPLVVHVIHSGYAIGEENNLSEERIRRQIQILNEDFRRKPGTRGFNTHIDGADSKIEFVLAKQTPDGTSFNGINRIDTTSVVVDILGYGPNHYAQYAYWNPEQYINIWTTPVPRSTECLALGIATGPDVDLPGINHLAIPQPGDAEGILVSWMHFGESEIECHARFGRTLTHEMGHYLGLLHTWGGSTCEFNDYCDDTPAVDTPVYGRTAFKGCQGEMVQIENYMNWSHDDVMNMFSKDQIERMRYVLTNHEGRNLLLRSKALETP